MAWKLLVTARAFWASGAAAQAALDAAGCETVRSPQAGPLPEAMLISLLQDCDAVIGSSDPYNARVFATCPQIKLVARCGVGIDSVDLNAATSAGVVVTNTPGAMTDAVADYTFALMLSLARRVVESDTLMHGGGWGEFPGTLIYGKTLGLVGFGQIGQGVARRAQGFAMRILAYDPLLSAAGSAGPSETFPNVTFTDLETLLAESDFVSVHAPKLPETQGMFNEARFAEMKPTACFINTARGALVDEKALLVALEQGQIAGAALDVYSEEPLPAQHPLRTAPHCLLTPHNAFNAIEAATQMSLLSAENLLAAMRGERPAGLCNPAVWQSPSRRLPPS